MKRSPMSPQSDTRILRNTVMWVALGLLLLTGCHTTAGFGQDLQSVGRNIQSGANKSNK